MPANWQYTLPGWFATHASPTAQGTELPHNLLTMQHAYSYGSHGYSLVATTSTCV